MYTLKAMLCSFKIGVFFTILGYETLFRTSLWHTILCVSNVHNKEYAPLKKKIMHFSLYFDVKHFFWPICDLWPNPCVGMTDLVGQLRPSIVHKMLKLWDFALSFIKAKATFFWYATYCGISKMAAIDLESSTWVKNWNILRFFWK